MEIVWYNKRIYRSFIASSLSAIPNFKFAIVNGGEKDEFYTNFYDYLYQEYITITQDDLKQIAQNDNFKIIYKLTNHKQNNQLFERLEKAILIYQKALDYRILENVYAEFFKAMEIASNIKDNKNIKEVLYSIGKKISNDGNIRINELIRKWRNEYTHESKFDEVNEYVVDIVRKYSRISIQFLIFLIKRGFVEDVALKHYYTQMSSSKSEFDVIQKMADLIK